MIFLKGRCSRCYGNVFWDEVYGSVHCMACGAIIMKDGQSVFKRQIDSKGIRRKIILRPAHTYQD